jgi:hypothetical protein
MRRFNPGGELPAERAKTVAEEAKKDTLVPTDQKLNKLRQADKQLQELER